MLNLWEFIQINVKISKNFTLAPHKANNLRKLAKIAKIKSHQNKVA